MFRKILIANRGEIACRVIQTAQKMGIQTVAVYSTPDLYSLHVSKADEAYWIGEAPSTDSYLNQQHIIDVAIKSGAQAIHPGYGFLSENPEFAKKCHKAGLVFIGPSVQSMDLMASKKRAKQLLDSTNVPLTPGYHGDDQSDDCLKTEAQKIGYPVLLKAAAGGGGKGMRAVYKESEFIDALNGARRESLSSFGDDTMVIEKLVEKPRHVEVQIMADNHGQVVHLFDRDCSIQRRHQKIIEEAPAPNLPEKLRNDMARAAITVAKKINYSGAGTVEFLVDDQSFYFMEMNTRLQVEHPVTEMVTGFDLVELQIRVAANEKLPIKQEDIQVKGHAIECRIYAEDPNQQFMPSTGTIDFFAPPSGEDIRVDTHIQTGSNISMYYDPMIAKLITFGKTRTDATLRMDNALQNFYLTGVKTNLSFLIAIINQPMFRQEELSTNFLNHFDYKKLIANQPHHMFLAACIDYVLYQQQIHDRLFKQSFGWESFQNRQWQLNYAIHDKHVDVFIESLCPSQLRINIDDQSRVFDVKLYKNRLVYICDGKQSQVAFQTTTSTITLFEKIGPVTIQRVSPTQNISTDQTKPQLKAPMPSTVVAILKKEGDEVQAGESIIVLEAMKMEHTITAPQDGIIKHIFFDKGEQVKEGAELVELKPIEELA